MKQILEITLNPEDEKNKILVEKLLKDELKKNNVHSKNVIFELKKRSLDARRKKVKIHLRYSAYIDELPQKNEEILPVWKNAENFHTVIIVGSGPAGLFGALRLLEKGIKPVIIERGQKCSERKISIAKISSEGKVNPNSNYCFGEGGAGTFSDGKLYTRSVKRGNVNSVLKIFEHFGADSKILTDFHPHIGTDKLPKIIENMRNFIIEKGGEFYFDFLIEDFITEDSCVVKGVRAKNVLTGEIREFSGDSVLLATGHSANDVYKLIAKKFPDSLEAKTFAAGLRVEHPRNFIDKIQFHKNKNQLESAEYRFTTQIEERGVYSFCMCPGGFVVPSASNENEIVVNGMSSAKRNSAWSNAAIVVEIRPEDIPQEFIDEAKKYGSSELAGLLFRQSLEENAKIHGKGQSAPSQKITDFINDVKSENLPKTSYTPGIVSSNLNEWIPKNICQRIQKALVEVNKKMKGFIADEGILIAIETRTSTPVRIKRNRETYESVAAKNLYPAGEGSGYSGGIVSSAIDGINACQKIIEKLI